jgi:hypothetical protein
LYIVFCVLCRCRCLSAFSLPAVVDANRLLFRYVIYNYFLFFLISCYFSVDKIYTISNAYDCLYTHKTYLFVIIFFEFLFVLFTTTIITCRASKYTEYQKVGDVAPGSPGPAAVPSKYNDYAKVCCVLNVFFGSVFWVLFVSAYRLRRPMVFCFYQLLHYLRLCVIVVILCCLPS